MFFGQRWPTGPLRFVARNLDTGGLVAERVGLAAGHLARAVGLIARRSLDPGEALWIEPSRGVHTLGMRFPIDLVALDEDGVVIDLVESLQPWRIRLPRPGTRSVLELGAGTLALTRTALGHRIHFEIVCCLAQGSGPMSDELVTAMSLEP